MACRCIHWLIHSAEISTPEIIEAHHQAKALSLTAACPPPPLASQTPQVRNLNLTDDAFTIIDIKAKGLAAENTVLHTGNTVFPQLPLPPGSMVDTATTVRATGQRPPRLQSVQNLTDFQVRLKFKWSQSYLHCLCPLCANIVSDHTKSARAFRCAALGCHLALPLPLACKYTYYYGEHVFCCLLPS